MTSIAVSRLARKRPAAEEKATGFGGRGNDKRRGAAGARGSLRFRVVPARFHGRWDRDLNVTRISVPQVGGNSASTATARGIVLRG